MQEVSGEIEEVPSTITDSESSSIISNQNVSPHTASYYFVMFGVVLVGLASCYVALSRISPATATRIRQFVRQQLNRIQTPSTSFIVSYFSDIWMRLYRIMFRLFITTRRWITLRHPAHTYRAVPVHERDNTVDTPTDSSDSKFPTDHIQNEEQRFGNLIARASVHNTSISDCDSDVESGIRNSNTKSHTKASQGWFSYLGSRVWGDVNNVDDHTESHHMNPKTKPKDDINKPHTSKHPPRPETQTSHTNSSSSVTITLPTLYFDKNTPIKTFGADPTSIDSCSTLLVQNEIKFLVDHVPSRYRGRDWQLVYSTRVHGFSVQTLYSLSNKISNSTNADCPSILVVVDHNGQVFGAFTSNAWIKHVHFYGGGSTFLFELRPRLATYAWTKQNRMFQVAKPDAIALGGGGKGFGLWLDANFSQGASQASDTFGNDGPISSTEQFRVVAIEVWHLCDSKHIVRD